MRERWFYWRSVTPEQNARGATIDELEKLIKSFDVSLKKKKLYLKTSRFIYLFGFFLFIIRN